MGNRENGNEPETIIATGVKVEGDFVSQGNVLIEGIVEGSLKTERDLRVGNKASISANVFAANATIAGEVRGNIKISEQLELEPSARLYGDVETKILVVASGAQVNGTIVMGESSVTQKAVKTKAADTTAEKASKKGESEEEVEGTKEKRTVSAFFTPKG